MFLSNFHFTIMETSMPKALKSPKIAQIRWNRYFWNADTLPFPKLIDFLKIKHFFYKGPVHKGSERFCTVPFGTFTKEFCELCIATKQSHNEKNVLVSRTPISFLKWYWRNGIWLAVVEVQKFDWLSWHVRNVNKLRTRYPKKKFLLLSREKYEENL